LKRFSHAVALPLLKDNHISRTCAYFWIVYKFAHKCGECSLAIAA